MAPTSPMIHISAILPPSRRKNAISRADTRLLVGSMPMKVPTCAALIVARSATSWPSATTEWTSYCTSEKRAPRVALSLAELGTKGWVGRQGWATQPGEQLFREVEVLAAHNLLVEPDDGILVLLGGQRFSPSSYPSNLCAHDHAIRRSPRRRMGG